MTERARGGYIAPDVRVVVPDGSYVLSASAVRRMPPALLTSLGLYVGRHRA